MGGLICCRELLLCRCGESGVGGVELGKSGREIALKRVRKACEQGGTLRCGNAGGSHLDLIYFLPCPAVGLMRAMVVRTYQVGDDLFIGDSASPSRSCRGQLFFGFKRDQIGQF